MTINCNVTGNERKRLAQVLGEILSIEPVYMKAPTFAYVLGDYTIDKDGAISCPESAMPVAVAQIVAKLSDEGFTPKIGEIEPAFADESAEDTAPAEIPAETPNVAPEAEPEAQPEDEAVEATKGQQAPDVAASEEASAEADQPNEEAPVDEDQSDNNQDKSSESGTSAETDDTKLTISIPRAKLSDDAMMRLRAIVSNKEELFKRALLADALPIEVTDEEVSFPWFTLTGIDGEAEAYAQFITYLCKMAVEQKRVQDKPYDGDNDRFAMRIFMVRMGMKGKQFDLARKLMRKHLTGNSGWRYEDSANKPNRNRSIHSTVQHLKKAYPNDTRIELIPMNDGPCGDIQIGEHGAVVGVDENGSVFIKLDNGSAFGITFSFFELPENAGSDIPFTGESKEELDSPIPEEDAPDSDFKEDDVDEE